MNEKAKQIRNEYMRQYKASMSPEAREAANEYQRKWRRKNPDKLQQYNISYWERKANQPREINENQVKNLHDQGMSLRQIGDQFGISHMKVKRILDSM